MLWKKESKSKVLYVNYFDQLKQSLADLDAIFDQSTEPAKSNALSDRMRHEGNIEFEAKNWSNAITAWNCALCFAEPHSETLSQAYANRSACHFQLDRYKSSNNDILYALQVPTCPDTLKQQLLQHQMDCADFIDKNDGDESMESFDCKELVSPSPPHTTPPPAPSNSDHNANEPFEWLSLDSSDRFRRCFKANADIDVGRIIYTEGALVSTLMSAYYTHCTVCFTKNDNLIPCENCTAAMFCNNSCQYSTLHAGECNLNAEINADGKLKLLIRTVLYAISLFNDIDDLVEFVMQTVSDDLKSTGDRPIAIDELTKYRQFLRLTPCQDIASGKQPDPLIYFAFKAIMSSKCGGAFTSEKRKRFLTHLIWQHQAIISLGYVHQHTNKFNVTQSLGVFPQFSHIKHSCTPNSMYYLTTNKLVVVALTPIKKGEEIFVSYFGKTALCDSIKDKRQERLLSVYKCFGQQCDCVFCRKAEPNARQRKQMKNDRMYRYISRICINNENGLWALKPSLTEQQLCDARGQAIDFLRSFGRMMWCKEMAKVAACFMDMIWQKSDSDDHLADNNANASATTTATAVI